MTNKNEVGYWIKRKGHEKFEDTKPERGFKAFAEAKQYVATKGEPVWEGGWRLTPDFGLPKQSWIHPHSIGYSCDNHIACVEYDDMQAIIVLIDGRYHWTDAQAKKDRWRDELYQKAGKRVIHIDAGLTLERYWVDLAYLFKAALESDKPVVYIHQ